LPGVDDLAEIQARRIESDRHDSSSLIGSLSGLSETVVEAALEGIGGGRGASGLLRRLDRLRRGRGCLRRGGPRGAALDRGVFSSRRGLHRRSDRRWLHYGRWWRERRYLRWRRDRHWRRRGRDRHRRRDRRERAALERRRLSPADERRFVRREGKG